MGLKLGLKIEEYSCMPIGELHDWIGIYTSVEGHTVAKKRHDVDENGNNISKFPTDIV